MSKHKDVGPLPKTITNPIIRYTDGGRSGTVHYTSREASFDLWYELAGGNAVAIIGIPEPRYWEAQTQTPLANRLGILQLIGEQVVKDQLTGEGYCLIEQDNIMTIYSGRKPT